MNMTYTATAKPIRATKPILERVRAEVARSIKENRSWQEGNTMSRRKLVRVMLVFLAGLYFGTGIIRCIEVLWQPDFNLMYFSLSYQPWLDFWWFWPLYFLGILY